MTSYSGRSSAFGSWGLFVSGEDGGFIPSTSRTEALRRFRASSRAAPFVKILEICMACFPYGVSRR